MMFKYHSFGVGYVEFKQLRMGSKLMLQWAPCVKKLYVYRNNISQKGMKQFIGAAANLIEVELAMDIVCAADMDDLLCASSSLVTVRCRGLYIPAHLPQQLVAFLTCLEPTYIEPPRMATFVLRARFERLLVVAAGMPHLRVLDIACKGLDDLRSRVQLLDIAELTLRLRLDKSGLRLDWVGQQHCGQLKLHMEIWSWDSPHLTVVGQLEVMNISHLMLHDCLGCGWHRYSDRIHAAYSALAAFGQLELDLLS